MDLVLDGRGPLYMQVARAIREAIVSGRVPDGSRIPASRDLALRSGLSRTTIVAAYRQLEAEGIVAPRVGDGSYVRAPEVPAPGGAPAAVHYQPQTAFARRARAAMALSPREGEQPVACRYSFRYDALQVNSKLPDEWARLVAKAARYVTPGYPPVQGLAALRAGIAEHVRLSRGIDCRAEDVLVVNGARQAYSLAARVILEAGESAAIEDPHYFGIRRVLEAEGAQVIGIPVDDDGMVVEALEGRHAKAVFVMPSHQFPVGSMLSPARRAALVAYARRRQAWIVEDDFGGEFRHGEPAMKALHSLDRGDRVVHVGSFSRTLFPAMRMGYVLMPRALREDFIAAKALSDFGASPYEQEALAGLIASGAYARHIRACTAVLADRRARLRKALAGQRFSALRVRGRNAGMHLVGWLDGLDERDVQRIVADAAARSLCVHPISPFYLRTPRRQALMLGFGGLHAAQIPAATVILADCLASVPAG